VLIPFLRKLITDKAETPPVEAAAVVPVVKTPEPFSLRLIAVAMSLCDVLGIRTRYRGKTPIVALSMTISQTSSSPRSTSCSKTRTTSSETEPRARSRQAERLNQLERRNHLSRGLDAIRDSRIASQGWLSGHFLITFGVSGSQPVRFHEDCERGANGIIYRKARRR
jgi:hypothetical protein